MMQNQGSLSKGTEIQDLNDMHHHGCMEAEHPTRILMIEKATAYATVTATNGFNFEP